MARAQQVERALHRGLATFQVRPAHQLDGYTEWFRPESGYCILSIVFILSKQSGFLASQISDFRSELSHDFPISEIHFLAGLHAPVLCIRGSDDAISSADDTRPRMALR